MREILLATNNAKKAREMSEILGAAAPHIHWRTLDQLTDTDWPEPVEDAETFMGNAELKARHYAVLSGRWTVADDSGLVVDALGGQPGVRSARYAGEPRSDAANNALLIDRLAGVPAERRTARFCCAVVLAGVPAAAGPASGVAVEVLARAEGRVEGRIVDEPRGTNGFGYDPHFLIERLGKTTAELDSAAKHAISHRGQALRQLSAQIARLLAVAQ